jgi:hypothetical protein
MYATNFDAVVAVVSSIPLEALDIKQPLGLLSLLPV